MYFRRLHVLLLRIHDRVLLILVVVLDPRHAEGEALLVAAFRRNVQKVVRAEKNVEASRVRRVRVENISGRVFVEGTRTVDYTSKKRTENTRVSYPINFIENALPVSKGGEPKNVFFLTYDAFGVLPPISKLTVGQAMYFFLSGFTSKVAGTEAGVTEPQTTFSTCFGAPFLPLHPTKYAELLGAKLNEKSHINVWLLNTGYTGGSYGIGKRMSLPHTRALITAVLSGKLNKAEFDTHPVFGLSMPKTCDGVPTEVLNPRNTWADKNAYDAKANDLAVQFNKNFEKYTTQASDEIKDGKTDVIKDGETDVIKGAVVCLHIITNVVTYRFVFCCFHGLFGSFQFEFPTTDCNDHTDRNACIDKL